MSLHVLLVSYFYPPAPEVGGLRAAKVAAALRARGHRVTVLTACQPGEGERVRLDEPGLRVCTVVPWRHPQQAWHDWRTGAPPTQGEPAPPTTAPAARGWDPDERVPRWKRWILSFLWLPDYRQGFIPAVARAARERLADDPADLLYTTAPPFSTHLAGFWLARRTGLPWITEFRDPWSDNPWKPARLRSRPAEALGRWLERACLRASARIIPVSEGIARLLAAKLPSSLQGRVETVRNGIDDLAPAPATPATDAPRRITYVGSFYLDRDPRLFLEALAAVVARHPAIRSRVMVDFVGHCRSFGTVDVEAEVRRLGLEELVSFRDWVPHEESRRLVGGASLLLLLARGQPAQIPNKLYEYLGTRRPILAFVDAEGECAAMLRQVGGHQVVTDTDPATATVALERALGLAPDPDARAPDVALLAQWTSAVQMRRLVELIESAAPPRSRSAPAPAPAPTPAPPAARQ